MLLPKNGVPLHRIFLDYPMSFVLCIISQPRPYDFPLRALCELSCASSTTSSAQGARSNQLDKSAFFLGRKIPKGKVERGEVEHALRVVARQMGLPEKEADATISGGLEGGMNEILRKNLEAE